MAAPATLLRLEIPPRPEFVAIARLVVSTAATARRDLSEERVADLTLALSEACTNAIEAHGAAAPAELVLIEVEEDEGSLSVTVSDRGPGFDPMELPAHPPVTDPERLNFERGLGIPIIRTLVDEATFTSDDGGTTVRLVVRCGPLSGARRGGGERDDLDDLDLEHLDLDQLDLDGAWDE